ncbi:MAG: 16S rRNA (cytidine(1402)-2'-O)-methyltransferase [Clostridiales bacterium]|nr:MAG: 16S rRNA (cytidine(1402)-2'-O)-methyltransferase [Clostridiales bacterium]
MEISLFLVATPIGNLSDMSPRAVETLKNVDFIAAEDTRNSGVLLKYFDIKTPMVSYHEHNEREKSEDIVLRLKSGQSCAIITDAGMPAISDPGQTLVRACVEAGLKVSAVPGPCAFITALAISGFDSARFCFEGFLSATKREKELEKLSCEERTMIFYEAPHKLKKTLSVMEKIFGNDRKVCLVREMTKIYEEALFFTLSEAVLYYREKDPKGEFVIVVEGGCKNEVIISPESIDNFFFEMRSNGKSKAQAAKETAARFGLKKNEIYDRYKED